jgi:hypothetical protein
VNPTIRPRKDSSQHRIQELLVSASVHRYSLSYIPSLSIIITLGRNIIIGPARKREEGTDGGGGEDEGMRESERAARLVDQQMMTEMFQ